MKSLILISLIAFSLTVDLNKAVQHLVSHAHKKSKHMCAAYVAAALKAGGFKFTNQASAYMYHSNGIMKKIGFKQIPRGKPKKGDVYVQDRTKSHVHGHMAMYSGKQWVSDFFQNSDQVYSSDAGKRYYYRYG